MDDKVYLDGYTNEVISRDRVLTLAKRENFRMVEDFDGLMIVYSVIHSKYPKFCQCAICFSNYTKGVQNV